MAEDVVATVEEPQDEPKPVAGSKVALINEEVNKALADHHGKGTVKEAVIQALVNERLEKNKSLVLTAISKIKELRGEAQKMERGGEKKVDLSGKVISTSYTKQDAEAYKKLNEKLKKLEGALTAALDKADYKTLEECCKDK